MAGPGKANPDVTRDTGVRLKAPAITVTGTASSVTTNMALPEGTESVRISVATALAGIAFGDSTVTVTGPTGVLMQAGMTDVFHLSPGDSHIAIIGLAADVNIIGLA